MTDELEELSDQILLRDMWDHLEPESRTAAFLSLSQKDAGDLFTAIGTADQISLIKSLPVDQASLWLRFLPPDDAADLIQGLLPEEREQYELQLDPVTRREVQALLAYSEDVAGGLMHPRYLRVRPEISVEVALRYIRRQTQVKPATYYYIYVLDADQRLEGVVSLHSLFREDGSATIAEIMHRDVVTVDEHTDEEAVARLFRTHRLLAIPVIDDDGRMKGIVTVDDIVEVAEAAATEDIQKLGGSESLGASYAHVTLPTMIRKRAGWLSALFVGEMLTATAMGYFEGEIARAVVLAMFVPLIISSGGNSGSQAATLIVRALALEEVKLRDWFRVFAKELTSGLCLGAWLGLIGFARVVLWQHFGLFDYGAQYMRVAATVGISLIGVVTFGTTVGSMLPFVLRRAGLDPATSSAPFVATLVDVTGLVIYFFVAAAILSGYML